LQRANVDTCGAVLKRKLQKLRHRYFGAFAQPFTKNPYLVYLPNIWYIYQIPYCPAQPVPSVPTLPTLESLPADASVRTRILAAAVEVLHNQGFSALTQNAVAAKAGVRQSHVTYYFPTRLDLLRNVAQFGCAQMINPITDESQKGRVTLAEFREFLLPSQMDRGWFRLMTGLMIACEEDPSIRNWLRDFDASVLARIHGAFCAIVGDVPIESVQMLHACFIGAMHLDMQAGDDASMARARRMVGLAIDSITARAYPGTHPV
jgi:AcrR family transcriptional regulator